MLYTDNLQDIIFQRHQIVDSDELIILSGYIGPAPIIKLGNLPLRATVIYGMYGSVGINPTLHTSLMTIQESINTLSIFYSNIPIHSKCYIWKKDGTIIYALIGSANFSNNGLTTPYREVLAETTLDTFTPLRIYIQYILNNSILCSQLNNQQVLLNNTDPNICTMTLLSKNGEVQNSAGLNWGQNPNNHTTPNDAYIAIRAAYIREFPTLFPPKQFNNTHTHGRGRIHRHNDSIEIIWDDGITMEGLLEGTQQINGLIYPKQISSFPEKSHLGEYIRHRIGVPLNQPVRKHHLESYGRTDIKISLLGEGVYKFDFSKHENHNEHA